MYIHQKNDWTNFEWDNEALLSQLGPIRNLQGKLLGRMESLGFELKNVANFETLTLDVLKSTEIEGELLNQDQVRSSLAKKLGLDFSNSVTPDRNVEGIVELMLDATLNYQDSLTSERIFSWHSALFPTGRSGMYKIIVGDWRKDLNGPMQVISGPIGKEKVHFQAPPANDVPKEMNKFIGWFNSETDFDPVIKAAIAHLWFITIHPFEDGNGRIARAITDMLLARSDGSSQRFYSMSSQIRLERNAYYKILESTQKGDQNITLWLLWFLNTLKHAIISSEQILSKVLKKADFWKVNTSVQMNSRQVLMINKLLDGFEGKLTSSKWAKICGCSQDTALRDIQDLINKKILRKNDSGGRNTHYELI